MDKSQQTAANKAKLEELYVSKDLDHVPKPAIVLDAAIARRHCSSMIAATKALGVGFRPHIKTHKTVELARLQIGDTQNVKLVVSTVAELEHVLPLLQELKAEGRKVNVLYGLPLPPSQVDRIASIARQLGPGSICFLVDHPSQLNALKRFYELAAFPGGIFVKVDTGYHRAGLPPAALNKNGLLETITALQLEGRAKLVGLYSHSSLSYGDTSPQKAMDNLAGEIRGCLDAVQHNQQHLPPAPHELTISVGASPQVVSIKNFAEKGGPEHGATEKLTQTIRDVSTAGVSLELHAGVYSVLDLQQLATCPIDTLGKFDEEIASSVVSEVVSVYNNGERQVPEALVAVGTLGLGREPCPSYDGWGMIGSLPRSVEVDPAMRLVVKRISQEHSIVSWDIDNTEKSTFDVPKIPLEVGQYVRIYPNHACITGAMYGWYFVVDSDQHDGATRIHDVWVRASGW